MNMALPPRGRFEWNFNTIVSVTGFALTIAAGLIIWGYTASEVKTALRINASSIVRIETRVERLETSTRLLDAHELRLTSVEERASNAASAMRAIEMSLNALASDIRVTREIVQRIEKAQNGDTHAPD